ncbi:MAG: hypothetical protein Q8R82_00080 [Hyphomonadaceae bacterium]|nr:hypothetical protein [Hyphomonadaceae bacterium]
MDGNHGVIASDVLLDAATDAEHHVNDVDQAQFRLLRASITDAVAVGLSFAGVVAALLPGSPELLVSGYAVATAPFVLAIALFGLSSGRLPFLTIGLVTSTLLLGAYAFTLAADAIPRSISSPWMSLLFGIALVPQFVALWASQQAPAAEGRKPAIRCGAIGLVGVATILVVASMALAGFLAPPIELDPRLLTALYVAALLPPIIANWLQARREGRLPVKRGDKQPDHISGLGATTLILFVLMVVTLGLWAAATGVNAQISVYAGLIVLVGLVVAFSLVAFGLPASRQLSALGKLIRTVVKPVGWLFSTIDSLLVFAVANALGANEQNWPRRFGLLLGSLAPCAALGWWLPAPYGIMPLALALMGSIAIARRWAWVEEDRENAMLARRFEGDHIRVGFTQDLKDEALIGFIALFAIVPIGLRQLHISLGGNVFIIDPVADTDHIFAWLSFFGTEMAKAVPFVDWTEIYRVEGSSTIRLDDTSLGVGQHVVFGMRILVDLVLLAAFLQAIAITQRTKKLKDMFYVEESLNRLDPFIEPHELGKLVRATGNGFEIVDKTFDEFPVYDPDRLEELKQLGDRSAVGFVASKLLERDEGGGPEERLSREARREKPEKEKCLTLLAEVGDTPVVQVGPLKAAHYALNQYAAFKQVRQAIVVELVRAFPRDARINALSEVLIGPSAGVQDPRQEVRIIALQGLFHPALEGNKVAQASIRHAAAHDPANTIKVAAREMLESSSDW